MDNAKVIEAMEKIAFQTYVEKLVKAEMRKITLFTIFPQTGAPNLSAAAEIVMVDDLSKISSLNSGAFLN